MNSKPYNLRAHQHPAATQKFQCFSSENTHHPSHTSPITVRCQPEALKTPITPITPVTHHSLKPKNGELCACRYVRADSWMEK